MPLLMCPNDNAAMQTLDRNGVQFDMCPTCRGVWLDRGELEKLMAVATEEGRAAAPQVAPPPTYQQPAPQQPMQQPMQQPWGGQPQGYREPPRYKDDRRRDDDYHYRKKKKRMDIFDIFD
ncbi:zf-TFIIB domain-containing protein [Brevundimonas sp. NPDC003935]|uniref:TFIIB-type zinc ribbon-containing protein n=1 Tax=unclassified Brevundimonas TaxID=2622653 RepID=UPI0028A2BD32|nr:zf-TFIIB domain-containing protein [Brevundimonas sp.]